VALGALLLAGILWALFGSSGDSPLEPGTAPAVTGVAEIGTALLTDFTIPFELISLVLLAAIVGAVVLAKTRLER
jgi:NADH-quinone oxidoreductase subunit J